MTMAFQKLLFRRMQEWQGEAVAVKGPPGPTQGDYALYLGFTPGALSNYLNGVRVPKTKESLEKLQKHLGMDLYDALDIRRPDPRLDRIIANWGHLNDAEQTKIIETVDRAIERAGATQQTGKGVAVPKRVRA